MEENMKHQSTEIGFSKCLLAIFIALFTFGIAVFVFPNPVVHAAPKAAISVDTISETSSFQRMPNHHGPGT